MIDALKVFACCFLGMAGFGLGLLFCFAVFQVGEPLFEAARNRIEQMLGFRQ